MKTWQVLAIAHRAQTSGMAHSHPEELDQLAAVAILSGLRAAADLERTTALGIRAYLMKPNSAIDCAELRKSLGTLVSDTVH